MVETLWALVYSPHHTHRHPKHVPPGEVGSDCGHWQFTEIIGYHALIL